MIIRINEVSLFVEDRGKGSPSLVFLHYWGGTHRTWNQVIEHLGTGFRTITYDSRGWGQSSPAASGYSLAALADEAQALIESLQLESYVLIGHSMGGKVAELLASRKLKGLQALVLVAPASPTPFRLPEEAQEQQKHAYDNRDTVVETIKFLSARTPDPEIVEQIVEDSLSGAPDAKRVWPTSAILEDISAAAAQIAVPTRVLAGEVDRLHPVEQHRNEVLTVIPNSTIEVIPGSGHLVPIDEPGRLADAIRRFLGVSR